MQKSLLLFFFSWLWYIKIRDEEFFFKNDCEGFLKERTSH